MPSAAVRNKEREKGLASSFHFYFSRYIFCTDPAVRFVLAIKVGDNGVLGAECVSAGGAYQNTVSANQFVAIMALAAEIVAKIGMAAIENMQIIGNKIIGVIVLTNAGVICNLSNDPADIGTEYTVLL